jgi:hypothetical protein
MPEPEDIFSADHQRMQDILIKITVYQRTLTDGRAVELNELQRLGILSSEDIDFMSTHSVTYKPHRVSDYHAMDMLHMPTENGCVFIGPGGPPAKERRIRLRDFRPIIQSFLKIPRPDDELLLNISFAEYDGVGVGPEIICFNFKSDCWRERLPAIRSVAAELGFQPFQDEVVQIYHTLTFSIPRDADRTSAAVVVLLSRGCGLTDESEVVYSAGALDEL